MPVLSGSRRKPGVSRVMPDRRLAAAIPAGRPARGVVEHLDAVQGQADQAALGPDGVGVVVQKSGYSRNLSFLGFESYINAKVLVEGLRLAGKE